MFKPYFGGGVIPYYINDKKGKVYVLLGLRRYNPESNAWSLFGGGFEIAKDDEIKDTAKRELYEEIGLDVPKDDLTLLITIKYFGFKFGVFSYQCNEMFKIKNHSKEIQKIKWFEIDKLPKNRSIFLEKEVVKLYDQINFRRCGEENIN